MDLSALPRTLLRVLAPLHRRARAEAGFTLIEAVLAMAIFAVVATALAGVMTSSISARSIASQRTAAEQIANTQLEWIRSLDYADVGLTTDANPRGIVDATGDQSAQGGPTVPSFNTVLIDIYWVDDRVPTAIDTKTSYKNVIVTVSRASDGKVLSSQSTQVGPRQRAAFGGIDKAIVNATVSDFLTNALFSNTLVRLNNGPSSPLGDFTDVAGAVRFPGLDAATGSTYYDLVVPNFNGYIQLPEPSVTHFQLAAGATPTTKVLQVYKPVTFTADFRNSNGTPYVGTVQFTVTNSRGSKNYTYTGTPLTIANVTNSGTGATELLVPGSYTITVTNQVAASFYTDPIVQNVPSNLSNYPSTLTGSTTTTADPLGTISATVTSAGGPVSGATVTVSGGPRSIPTRTATTNASGVASFANLPAGSGYTVTAAKGGQSAPNQTPSVSGGSTTNLTFDFPVGHLKAVVTWAGVKVVGATVTLTGGPGAISLSGTSDANGEVLFSNAPAGSGYTMTTTMSGQSAVASPTVVGATTTTVPVAMPTVSVVATVTWIGANVTGANVSLSGGPMSLSTISAGPTTSSGQVTFSNVPAGGGYTLAATKNLQTTTLTSQSFTTSPTTSVGVALPTGTIAINAATWAGAAAGTATVTITGGPNSGTYGGTTNASGVVNVVVPATTSGYPYTVDVTKNGGSTSPDPTVSSLASGGTAPLTPVLTPTKTLTLTIYKGASPGTLQKNVAVTVSITGGPNGTAGAAPAYTWSGTTNSTTGKTAAITVPAGTGNYTVKVSVNPCPASGTNRSNGTGTTVSAAAGTTTANIYMSTSGCLALP